ncbi:MAG: metalloregulator ArsR/SmtB family transcription factor [Proteobacteria bacterium]|nr:metalloregulator ArsR/SmtB family transcription factor [Pseudomonadota bacterium]MBU1688595.1 metalloregulator ArsR/SmtB family transcription factor [Pseudomonadota bacterium]
MRNITQLFKALSDPTRLRIVWLLQTGGELCVCDLMEVLGLPQSTVSRHLAYLRNADLVIDQRKGIWMYYRLPDQTNVLVADILRVLSSSAKVINQADQDHQQLNKYIKTKPADTCGSTRSK